LSFCTAINCMDGRVQIPVIDFLKKRFNVKFVDVISEPGPNKILCEKANLTLINSILDRVKISVEKHQSVGLAITGHFDCAGNPTNFEKQREHIFESIKLLRQHYAEIPIIGLWVDENWKVHELPDLTVEHAK